MYKTNEYGCGCNVLPFGVHESNVGQICERCNNLRYLEQMEHTWSTLFSEFRQMLGDSDTLHLGTHPLVEADTTLEGLFTLLKERL